MYMAQPKACECDCECECDCVVVRCMCVYIHAAWVCVGWRMCLRGQWWVCALLATGCLCACAAWRFCERVRECVCVCVCVCVVLCVWPVSRGLLYAAACATAARQCHWQLACVGRRPQVGVHMVPCVHDHWLTASGSLRLCHCQWSAVAAMPCHEWSLAWSRCQWSDSVGR